MSVKAILVVTILSATGDPAFPPKIDGFDNLQECEAAAKAAVEALALAHEERLTPARVKDSPIAAVRNEAGVWMIRYNRTAPQNPGTGDTVVGRNVRAVCRATAS